jgi:hypothetical protein
MMMTDASRDEFTGVHNLGVLFSEFYCPAYDSTLLDIYLRGYSAWYYRCSFSDKVDVFVNRSPGYM